jgi:hypothetical protein
LTSAHPRIQTGLMAKPMKLPPSWRESTSWTQTTLRLDREFLRRMKLFSLRRGCATQDFYFEALCLRIALAEGGEQEMLRVARAIPATGALRASAVNAEMALAEEEGDVCVSSRMLR